MSGAIGLVWVKVSHRRRRTSRLKGDDYHALFKSLIVGVLGAIVVVAALVTGQGGGWEVVALVPLCIAGLVTGWFVLTEPKTLEDAAQFRE